MAKASGNFNFSKGQLQRQTSALLTERSALIRNSQKGKTYGHDHMSASKSRHPKVQKIASAINQVISMCKGENNEATDEFGKVIKAQQGIYDLLIPNYESQLITDPEKNRTYHQGDNYDRKRGSNADPNYHNEYNINPSQNNGRSNPTNVLGDDAIFMIEEIEKKALQEIQILRNEKAQLIRLLNIQIQNHELEKRRRIWLEGELQRVVNHLRSQGINIYPNEMPFQSVQSLSVPIDSPIYHPLIQQRIPSRTFDVQETRNRAYVDGQGFIRTGPSGYGPGFGRSVDQEEQNTYQNYIPHSSNFNQHVQNNPHLYTNPNQRIGANKGSDKFIKGDEGVLKNKLVDAQNRAAFLKSEIERLKATGQGGANSQLYNLLLQLLQEGQRIRKQTIRLLKNKQGSGDEDDRVRYLEQQLEQQEENKLVFMEDLKKFKQKYKELEEENERLKGGQGKPSKYVAGPKGKGKLNDHESFLSEIRKVTSN